MRDIEISVHTVKPLIKVRKRMLLRMWWHRKRRTPQQRRIEDALAVAENRAFIEGTEPPQSSTHVEPCLGMDGPLPCSKWAGHDGPHYFYRP